MNILIKILETESTNIKTITKLSCVNCMFMDNTKVEDIKPSDLNSQGGTISTSPKDLLNAEKSRLITLPGKQTITTQTWCNHPDVAQWVSKHMWCTKWEAPGTLREF